MQMRDTLRRPEPNITDWLNDSVFLLDGQAMDPAKEQHHVPDLTCKNCTEIPFT
jgi:hypothetical protein